MNGLLCETAVRYTLYVADCWITKKRAAKVHVIKMHILIWMCGATRKGKIRDNSIRGNLLVASIVEKRRNAI